METQKSSVPVGWPNDETYRFNILMGAHLWNKLIDAGYDPGGMVAKFQELGDGRLAVAFFEDEESDLKNPLPGAGFIVPMGFWYTADRRIPLNWVFAEQP